eukprot:8035556-Pyramimonas_sp.AAC.1
MRDACDTHDHSVRFGFAGRRNWWLNSGRLDRGTWQKRGFITIVTAQETTATGSYGCFFKMIFVGCSAVAVTVGTCFDFTCIAFSW